MLVLSPVVEKTPDEKVVYVGIIPGLYVKKTFKGAKLKKKNFTEEFWKGLNLGVWLQFKIDSAEVEEGPLLEVMEADIVVPSRDELYSRQYSVYKKSGQHTNKKIFRTDGYTSKEAKAFKGSVLTYEEYFEGYSEEGLKSVCKSSGLPYTPGIKVAMLSELVAHDRGELLSSGKSFIKAQAWFSIDFEASLEPIDGDLVVDGSCYDSFLKTEWQGVLRENDKWQKQHKAMPPKSFGAGTNNVAEFLAIVDALRLRKNGDLQFKALYSDSITALRWLCNGRANYQKSSNLCEELIHKCNEAREWLEDNFEYIDNLCNDGMIRHWKTKLWNENPADFSRK